MKTRTKVFIGLTVWFAFALILFAIFGSDGKNEEFQPQNEFKLDPWIELKLGPIDMSINKAVMYIFIAATLTTGTMIWIARRMTTRPNKVQAGTEWAYDGIRKNLVGQNMDDDDGEEVVRVHRDPLLLHLVLEHDRLHPAADQHRAHGRRVRARTARVRDLRRDREHLDPAGADPGRLGRVPRRGHPGEGLLRLHEELHPAGHVAASGRRRCS